MAGEESADFAIREAHLRSILDTVPDAMVVSGERLMVLGGNEGLKGSEWPAANHESALQLIASRLRKPAR